MNTKLEIIKDLLYNELDDIKITAYAKKIEYDEKLKIFFIKCHDSDIYLQEITYFIQPEHIDIEAKNGEFIISPSIKDFSGDIANRYNIEYLEYLEDLENIIKNQEEGKLIELLEIIEKKLNIKKYKGTFFYTTERNKQKLYNSHSTEYVAGVDLDKEKAEERMIKQIELKDPILVDNVIIHFSKIEERK